MDRCFERWQTSILYIDIIHIPKQPCQCFLVLIVSSESNIAVKFQALTDKLLVFDCWSYVKDVSKLCKRWMEQQIQPVQVPRWPSNCASGIKTKLKDFSGERLKKKKFNGASWFFTGDLSKNYVWNMLRYHQTCCYFSQNPKCKGSISLSNFDGTLQIILFTFLCLCVRILGLVAVA